MRPKTDLFPEMQSDLAKTVDLRKDGCEKETVLGVRFLHLLRLMFIHKKIGHNAFFPH